ncbi:hypothetical protein J3E69DRAFT_359599 [Trichoderma sp. SZMC 28015]
MAVRPHQFIYAQIDVDKTQTTTFSIIAPHQRQRRISLRYPTSHHITLWPPTRFTAKSAQLKASRITTLAHTTARELQTPLCTNHINTISENSTQKLSAGFNSGLSSGSPGRSSGEVGRFRSKQIGGSRMI